MKKPKEDNYEAKFLAKFLKSEDLKRQKEVMGTFFKNPVWWFVKALGKRPPKYARQRSADARR